MKDGHKLRTYRHSLQHCCYSITVCTFHRRRYFTDFFLARQIIKALKYQDDIDHSQTLAFVVMPDHFHWLFELKQSTLEQVMLAVKSYTAHDFGATLWQTGYYEHTVRQQEDLVKLSRYIVANPLRAGLVTHIGDYPLWGAVWLNGDM